MKLKITKLCYDKYTGEYFEIGKEYDFEDERAKDILERGLGEVEKATKAEEPKVKETEEVQEAKEEKKFMKRKK